MDEAGAPAAEQADREDAHARRPLRRSRRDRIFAGVCGGLGEYLGIEPVLLRVAFVILAVASFGYGILAYALLALAIPKERYGEQAERPAKNGDATYKLVGLSLIALGGIFLFNLLIPIEFALKFIGPIILIAAGVAILVRSAR